MGRPSFAKRQTPGQIDMERRHRLATRSKKGANGPPDGVPALPFSERRAMRRDGKPAAASSAKAAFPKALPSAPPAAIIALSRLGFGPSPGDVAAFDALAGDDVSRLTAWVDQQLDPASIDDSAAEARLAQAGYQTLGKNLAQLWAEHTLNDEWEIHMLPFWETQRATFLRAIHSKRQLFETMVGFWHDHFSVFADDSPHGSTWVHSDRDAIRPNALGNFRQMLEAVTRTPAMLFYLDNVFNNLFDANENFARELMELHTMGAEAYMGNIAPGQVPLDDDGVPVAYVEDDVIAAARCLTGWTLDTDWVHWEFGQTGTFLYWDDWHDHEAKSVLGLDLPPNQDPMQDGRDLLDRLAQHPATARHIAGKIARRLLGDFPPQGVVEAAAAVFQAQHAAPDQIAQVVRTIVLSPEFLSTWADKVKRPFDIAISSFRALGRDLPFTTGPDDWMSDWFMWEFYQTGQPLFSWHPPNGYPDIKFAWNTTAPRIMSWRLANWFVTLWDDDNDIHYFDLVGQTPAGVLSAQALVDHWGPLLLGRPLPAGDSEKLVAFMAQGANPLTDLPLDDDWETQERLRAMVALVLMSPSFLWR